MAFILKTNGETEQLDNNKLATMQKAVGGNIELLHTIEGNPMFVNEDGKKLDLSPNIIATELWAGHNDHPDEMILGNVVIGKEAEFNDE